jgi:hypothetical protein
MNYFDDTGCYTSKLVPEQESGGILSAMAEVAAVAS